MSIRALLSILLGVTLFGVSSPVTLAQKGVRPPQVKPVDSDFAADLAEKAACMARLKTVYSSKSADRYIELFRQETQTKALLRQLERNPQANASRIVEVENKLNVLQREIGQVRAQICSGPGEPGAGKSGAGNH